MNNRRGLGRGLASLIPDSALDADALPAEREALRVVPITELRANPEQPREIFDKDALTDLAASIAAYGVLSPLVVRRHDGRYFVIAGERRLRAATLAGLTEVPVIVREADAPSRQLELALVENLQRTDLDPIEAARGFQRLIDEYGYTQDKVASSVGKDRSTIANLVRLLKLPDFILSAMREGKLTAGHARAMLPLSNEDDHRAVLSKIVAQGLSVRQTERLVSEMAEATEPTVSEPRRRERPFDYAVKLLEEALQTKVSINQKPGGGGRIMLDYSNAEELERLIALLQRAEG